MSTDRRMSPIGELTFDQARDRQRQLLRDLERQMALVNADQDITVEGRVVTIEGTRKVIHKGGSQEETFSRSFTVANQYNLDKAKASQVDGVLTLTFPKNKVENGGKKIIDID